MKSTGKSDASAGKELAQREGLESLVDELIKSSPNETKIRAQMRMAGLEYSKDAVLRMSLVLEALESSKLIGKKRGRDHVQDL